MIIWVVDDDTAHANSVRELTNLVLGPKKIHTFSTWESCLEASGVPDIIILDLSIIGSITSGPYFYLKEINVLINKYHATTFIVNSGISYANEVVKELKEAHPYVDIRLTPYAGLKAVLT